MGARAFFDGFINAITGQGTRADPRRANGYRFVPLSYPEIQAAYRGSGLMRKVIDIPALDMVREWRDWQAEADVIELLEAEERRLDIRGKVRTGETLRGLGGGALVLGIGNDDPTTPIDPARIAKQGLRYVLPVSRWQITLGEKVLDPLDPLFGGPAYFELGSAQITDAALVKIHPSRVVCFRGDPVPVGTGIGWNDEFWGDSRVQRVLDAVQNSDSAQNGFAGLIKDARNTIIGIPGLTEMCSTSDGEQTIGNRVAALSLGQSMYNATFYDAGDGSGGANSGAEVIEHRQVTWTGIPDVMNAFVAFVAAVADIPATRLLGKSPDGMNATGRGDHVNWNKMVKARQELELRPCLDQLDAVLIPSATGQQPTDIVGAGTSKLKIWWEFSPLDALSETEDAAVFASTMDAVVKLQTTGTIPDVALSKGVQGVLIENGWLPGLEGALAELPEDERYPEPGDPTDPNAVDPSEIVPMPAQPGGAPSQGAGAGQ